MPGEFLRRSAAWALDCLILFMIIGAAAPFIYSLSGGWINYRGHWGAVKCEARSLSSVVPINGISFAPDRVQDCRYTTFGLTSGRFLEISKGGEARESSPGQSNTYFGWTDYIAFPLDREGNRVSSFPIGWRVEGLVIALLLTAQELVFRRTVGKTVFALHVVAKNGRRASAPKVFLRNVLLFSGWILAGILAIFEYISGYSGSTALPHGFLDAAVMLSVIATVFSMLLIRPSPLHDFFAGTQVEVVTHGWWAGAIGRIFASGSTWSLAGRALRARNNAFEELEKLQAAAGKLQLVGVGWQNPFSIGFLWRHVVTAQEFAAHNDALSRFRKNYPWEAETRALMNEIVSPMFGVNHEVLGENLSNIEHEWNQESDFVHGALLADRILHIAKSQQITIVDDHTKMVSALYIHMNSMAHRSKYWRWIPVSAEKAYAFLVARTLGERSFSLEMQDYELAKAIGIVR